MNRCYERKFALKNLGKRVMLIKNGSLVSGMVVGYYASKKDTGRLVSFTNRSGWTSDFQDPGYKVLVHSPLNVSFWRTCTSQCACY